MFGHKSPTLPVARVSSEVTLCVVPAPRLMESAVLASRMSRAVTESEGSGEPGVTTVALVTSRFTVSMCSVVWFCRSARDCSAVGAQC